MYYCTSVLKSNKSVQTWGIQVYPMPGKEIQICKRTLDKSEETEKQDIGPAKSQPDRIAPPNRSRMSEDNASDMYEEAGDSDSEPIYTYYPFIKIENDGSVLIDGQPSNQDASQMSIEAAEVLVLPFEGMIDLQALADGETKFEQIIEESNETTVSDSAIASEDTDISDTLLHDHNYEEVKRPIEPKCDINLMYQLLESRDPTRNICTFCKKSFNTTASLKRHLRIHTGERPFQCQICDKYFSQQSNLCKHVRTHTGERPFECPQCNKRFSQRANMKKHLIIHSGERPFVCCLCSRGFTQQANLSKHMRLHTGEKPYGCTYCEKRFTQRSNLQKHERLHEGIKPYTCEICFQAFTQQSNLRKHEMMHSNIKKFICDICHKGYIQKVSLLKHKQRCMGVAYAILETDEDDKVVCDDDELLQDYEQCLEDDEEGAVVIKPEKDYIFSS